MQIHWVQGLAPHRLGLMARPRGGEDLRAEVEAWRRVGVDVVASLLEPAEVRELELREQPSLCAAHGLEFRSFPMPDRGTPRSSRELALFLDGLLTSLLAGKTVVMHCRAGIGRTGLVAGCLVHRLGVPAQDVFHVLSRSRGLAMPDTTEQLEWFENHARAGRVLPDPWLERWLPLLREAARSDPVLEIGCGTGDDTQTLAGAGLQVVGFDLSEASVAATARRVPAATVTRRDLRDPFPVAEGGAGAVVASLTLHYFPWAETVALVERIRRTLRPTGVFLCRLNSTGDRHFGSTDPLEIEPNYRLVDGRPKRFFDENDIDRLFSPHWRMLSKEHRRTRKYVEEKSLWEIILRRGDD